MGLSTEAILAIIGLFVALPPTALAMWKCWSLPQKNRKGDREVYHLSDNTVYLVTAQVELRRRNTRRDKKRRREISGTR
ncbi:hypothetical protein F5Y12DRAFT_765991 [Xylaria sp. FL1777]|nr:hypothetical protein F5Y12DRAFT_765991 [Xylaria sp. FL1777]